MLPERVQKRGEGEEEDTAKLFLDDSTKIFENFPITLSRHGNVRWTVGEIRRTLFKKDSLCWLELEVSKAASKFNLAIFGHSFFLQNPFFNKV